MNEIIIERISVDVIIYYMSIYLYLSWCYYSLRTVKGIGSLLVSCRRNSLRRNKDSGSRCIGKLIFNMNLSSVYKNSKSMKQ